MSRTRCFLSVRKDHIYKDAYIKVQHVNSHIHIYTHTQSRYVCINKLCIYIYYIDAINISSRNIYGADMRQREKRGKRKKYIYIYEYIAIYIFTYFQNKPLIDYL